MTTSYDHKFINNCVNNIKTRKLIFTKFKLNLTNIKEYTNVFSLQRNVPGKLGDFGETATSKVVEKSESLREKINSDILQAHFNEFLTAMKGSGCCYVVYDFGFYNSDGAFRNTLCLISFVPDNEPMKEKFTYSSHSLTLKGILDGVGKLITINGHDQLTFKNIENECQSFSKF